MEPAALQEIDSPVNVWGLHQLTMQCDIALGFIWESSREGHDPREHVRWEEEEGQSHTSPGQRRSTKVKEIC